MRSTALALLLAGCATIPPPSHRLRTIQARVGALVGHAPDDVVLALGPPDREATVDGVEVLTYARFFGYADGARVTSRPGELQDRWPSRDTVHVYVRSGIVVGWDAEIER